MPVGSVFLMFEQLNENIVAAIPDEDAANTTKAK
jgi:hypothetical protein